MGAVVELLPDELRQKTLRRLAEAVVRCRGDRDPITYPVYEALREAANDGGKDAEWRGEAAGLCDGVHMTIIQLDRVGYLKNEGARLHIQPFIDAVQIARELMRCDTIESMKGFVMLVDTLIARLEEMAKTR